MRVVVLASAVAVIAGPAFAAEQITFFRMMLMGSMTAKLVMLGLIGSTTAAVIICLFKLMRREPTGGSAFISGLRVGGPIVGLLGLVWGAIQMLMGVATSGALNFPSMAPGIAEGLVTLFLGLLAGAVAILANALVNSRIDRALLKS